MEKLPKLKSKYSQGFSLLEVVISLLIFSSSVIAIYQIIVSAQVSSQTMRDQVMAREITNNRYAMLETIDYPINLGSRSGIIKMAGQDWLWEEETKDVSQYLNEFSISISLKESEQVIFVREGYIEKR